MKKIIGLLLVLFLSTNVFAASSALNFPNLGVGGGGSCTPTSISLTGMCSATPTQSMWACQSGKVLKVRGSFTCGTVQSSAGKFTLTGYTIDSTKISNQNTPKMGEWHVLQNASTQINASVQSGHIFYNADTAALYIATHVASNSYTNISNWQTIMGGSGNETMEVEFEVPVQ